MAFHCADWEGEGMWLGYRVDSSTAGSGANWTVACGPWEEGVLKISTRIFNGVVVDDGEDASNCVELR